MVPPRDDLWRLRGHDLAGPVLALPVGAAAHAGAAPVERASGRAGQGADGRHPGQRSQVRLLAREVDHRAKNALAVVQATLQLTPKKDLETYVEAVAGRVSALARAQALLSQNQWRGASLQALLKAELTPFVSEAGGEFNTRAELDGLAVLLPPAAAQPLAMAMHELATNALKHGALSVPGGQATVSWRLSDTAEAPGDLLILRWEESKGPPVKPPTRRGFGFRMLEAIVRGQLGGRLSLSWLTSGFVCEIEMSLTRPGRASEEGALKKAG
ncbi:HWE histidine kinase domain-containing protein [Pseudoroseomonas wenyumeiae]